MDPVSAISLIGSVLGVADIVTRSINKLSLLKTKYRQADLDVSALLGQLCTLQAALSQLAELRQSGYAAGVALSDELANAFSNSLDGYGILVASLEESLEQLEIQGSGQLSGKGKLSLLWNGQNIKDYIELLDRQVNALNLLLHAIQCKGSTEQRTLMQEDESITIMRLVRECTDSLYVLEDTASRNSRISIVSEDTINLSLKFDFDFEILGSRVYQAATKANVRALLKPELDDQRRHPDGRVANLNLSGVGSLSKQQAAGRSRGSTEDVGSNVTEDIKTANGPPSVLSLATLGNKSLENATPAKLSITTSSTKPILRQFSTFRRRRDTINCPELERETSIEARMKQVSRDDVPVLICGIPESGKSTLLKSMKQTFEAKVSDAERTRFRAIVFANIVLALRALLEAMQFLEIPLDHRLRRHARMILLRPLDIKGYLIYDGIACALETLWADEGIRECYRRRHVLCWRSRHEYQRMENLAYYAKEIRRIAEPSYLCSDKDILMSYVKTTSVTRDEFDAIGVRWQIFDVDTKRDQWLDLIEHVNFLIYAVDITCYDKSLFENGMVNCMLEALNDFERVVNCGLSASVNVVLVFTKMDILISQIKTQPPVQFLPDFMGGISLEAFKKYIAHRFVRLNRQKNRIIKVRFTGLEEGTQAPGQVALGACKTILGLQMAPTDQ